MSDAKMKANSNVTIFYPFVEILRLLGAMAVVWSHYGRFRIPVVKIAVPCFVVISFFFGWRVIASGEFARLRRSLIRFAVPFFAWGALSYIVAVILGTKTGIAPLLWQLLLGHSTCMPLYYLWDVAVMMAFLFVLFRCLSVKAFWWVSGCIAAVCLCLQYSGLNYRLFGQLPFEVAFPLGRLVELFPSALAGCAIASGILTGRRSLVIGSILAACSTVLLFSGIKDGGDGFGYAGLVLLSGAVGFVLMSTAYAPQNPLLVKIRLLSEATAGVYFIHTIVGDILHSFKAQKFTPVFLVALIVTLIGLRIPFICSLFNGRKHR